MRSVFLMMVMCMACGGAASENKAPTVKEGEATVGDGDKETIRASLRQHLKEIEACYQKALVNEPNLEGTVNTSFVIDPQGVVASATATGMSPEINDCVAGVIKTATFPAPKGGGQVTVTSYPFSFKPSPG
jgi:hypothetical protein